MFLLLGFGYYQRGNQIARLEADNLRLLSNQNQLSQENNSQIELTLKKDEFIKVLSDSLKQSLALLKIKPKTIIKYEERVITQRDTIIKEVPVSVLKKDSWLIHDEGKCYLWEGVASLSNDSLNVRKINFSYHNKVTDIYRKVPKRKLLGIIPIGKKIVHTQTSDCGETISKVINIIK